jgi:hypothetical protein
LSVVAGGDTLASLGEKVTDVFVSAFASGNPSVSLVFLPFALPTPDDIVQGGVVNPTRLASFISPNFDAPYLMSASQYTVHGRDLYYGSLSQIYTLAATTAQATAAVGSDAWKRVNAEIAMAQSVLNPAGVTAGMACVPDDWVLPDTSYWSTFDSTQSQSAPNTSGADSTASGSSGAGAQTPRVFNPALWTIKPAAAQAAPVHSLVYLHALAPAVASPLVARPMMATRSVALEAAAARETLQVDPSELSIREKPGVSTIWRHGPIILPLPPKGEGPPLPPPPPPPPSSSMSVHFEYMSATIGFMAAGTSIWNGVFLADPNWCVPGMAKGGLLPAPDAAAAQGQGPLAYGIPIAIIVVRNLNISVKWSGQEQASLGDSGFLGPFSLAGASATNTPDGLWTYSRPGMQVVALLCSHLPMLPPTDAPDVAQAGGAAKPTQSSDAGSKAAGPS